ncbi:MAG TPA: MgtC/SapB family protein [Acidobacteriaceae bacterium]|nr:MgtC/SapB family protein [Acidobacteriaceae bacterium]
MVEPGHIHFSTLEQMILSGPSLKRLLMASALGAAVGLEREWRHKDSGLRTNILICMGSALFTIMSVVIAGDTSPNRGQIASNIVQGIGFLGAGLILHTKNRVLGLTSAATVWVVAAIGITCGAGLYIVAALATLLVLISLQLIGVLEGRLGWKRYPKVYEVRADIGAMLPGDIVGPARAEDLALQVSAANHRMQLAILKVLDSVGQRLAVLDRDNIAGIERVSFIVTATHKIHHRIHHELEADDATDKVVVFNDTEEE